MKPFYVINDTHCGVVRSAGTTPVTALKLRYWVIERFKKLLLEASGGDLLILGDLFDTFNVPYMDVLEVLWALQHWLNASGNGELILVPGNHDLSKTTTTMSSFQFLASILQGNEKVTIMDKPGAVFTAGEKSWVIPHLPNQDQFDIALTEVPKDAKFLFLHSNYDNKFAQQQDHSLNLSPDQARACPASTIVLAHEHQRRTELAGKVVVIGNQIPTSVADCLGNDAKYMLRIEPTKRELVKVWDREGSFQRVDWRDLSGIKPETQFIRVSGDANTLEAQDIPKIVSKLRSTHSAFVVTNAVKVAGRDNTQEKISLESIQAFDVLKALMKRLNPEQQKVVAKLVEENNVSET